MIRFLEIYCGLGVFFAWLVLELGHWDAKRKNQTLHELHQESMKDEPPEVQKVFHSPWVVLFAVFLLWWAVIPAIVFGRSSKE